MIPIKKQVNLHETEDSSYLYYSFNSAYEPQSGINELMMWLRYRKFENWQIHSLEYLAFTDMEEASRFTVEYPNLIE